MTRIDIISGFLGAGKTTLIKKLLKEALAGEKVVLIENEFGEIGVDGGFLKEAGIEIKEMNSGCICCSLVGDFGTSLKEVLNTYQPERILIEPSGVGKLSDVVAAVTKVEGNLQINSTVAVVDASKCKMYIKNFGEFFLNQIEYAGTIILSRTGSISDEKLEKAVELIRQHNQEATIITTPWEELEGQAILKTMEKKADLEAELLRQVEHEHHEHGEDCGCGHHHEEGHGHHEHGEGCGCGHHHEEGHEHHEYGEGCGCGHHHEEGHEHHEHGENCGCGHHHKEGHSHHHEHSENCGCGHDHAHGHHHADEVFTSWGRETPKTYTKKEIGQILEALEDEHTYGMVLRAKGMVQDKEKNQWIYFDYVPGEVSIREGKADVTGKLCVIGSGLKEDRLSELFAL